MGALLADPPGASTVVSVRIAVSSVPGRTVRWGSLEVSGNARAVAWLIPVAQGAALDLSSDAWLESLEAATAPRVIPPDLTPPCGISGGVEVEGDFTHAMTTAPGAVAVTEDRAALDSALSAWGVVVTSDVAPGLDAAFAEGSAVVALLYPNAPSTLVTKTVRVVDDTTPALPLGLLQSGAASVPITAFVVGSEGAQLGSQPALGLDPSSVLWNADGTSTYATVRDSLLLANPGGWLFATGGNGILFAGATVPGGSATPAIVDSYDARAASYADATEPPDTCIASADQVAMSEEVVAWACPAGSLARVPSTSDAGESNCTEAVGAGQVDPSVFRCGGIADDLAISLSGLAPSVAWVTRARGSIGPVSSGATAAIAGSATAGAYGPVLTASGYGNACADPASSSGGSSGMASNGGGNGGGGGTSGTGGANDPGGAAATGVTVAANAAAVASSASDGCGGDSSDSEGDSCGGDSSSSDSSGDGCGSSDSSSGCSMGPRRRLPLSPVALLVVALAAVARRRSRASSSM
jgi:hypothetical protein